jgi:two-component system response regulator AtoC
MTAYGSVDNAIDCLRKGAADYILKPFNMDDLIIRVNRLLDAQSLKTRYEVLEENCKRQSGGKLFGNSPAMQQVYTLIDQVAPTKATVLVTGESGTGKELAARSIHMASKRQNQPFVSINCAAIPEGLMESELFGHERGAFTGAELKRKGKFELADKGTLLLDELGDLPGPLQAKLLRVLQESQFERVGGSKSISVDVRILACTSKDLQKEVEEGRFRQDLLYRLQVIPLRMPPLREHKDDIELLCKMFLQEFNSLHGKSVTITPGAIDCLKAYNFPGNARELRNLMERASVLCQGPEITPADLPADINNREKVDEVGFNLSKNMAFAEKNCLLKALRQSNGNRTETSKLLGISRKNLWEKMKSHNIQ